MPDEHVAEAGKYLLQFDWPVALLMLAGIAAIQYGLAVWLRARLMYSIQHEYQKQLEDYRYQIEIRRRAADVATYLSTLTKIERSTDVSDLNRMAWELALWLPSDLYCRLAHAVIDSDGRNDWKPLLIEIRKELLQNPDDELIAENIIHHRPGT